MMATLGLVMCGCSDEVADREAEQPTQLQVTGQIRDLTRAVNKTEWAQGDVIGLCLAKAGGEVRSADVRYVTTGGDGTFEPVSDPLHIAASDGEMVVTGYYPCAQEALTEPTYVVSDWTDNATRPDLDLLWGQQTCSSATPSVLLQFHHQFTKVVIHVDVVSMSQNPYSTLTADSLKGMTVTAEGLNYPVSVDLLTGEATLGAPNEEPLAVPMNEDGTAGELIFAPGITAPGRQMILSLPNDRQLVWRIADTKVFEAGKAYQYNLTLSSTQMEVEATVEGTIIAWADGGEYAETIAPE